MTKLAKALVFVLAIIKLVKASLCFSHESSTVKDGVWRSRQILVDVRHIMSEKSVNA